MIKMNKICTWLIANLIATLVLLSCSADPKRDSDEEIKLGEPIVYVVSKNDKYGLIDGSGRERVPVSYKFIQKLSEDYYYVRDGLKWKVINADGEEVLASSVFDKYEVERLSGGLLIVKEKRGKYGAINMEGNTIVPCIYDEGFEFSEGFAAVRKSGKAGFIDTHGKEVVPFIYEWCYAFSDGIASVCRQGKWGGINNKGDVIIDIVYDWLDSFKGGFAYVKNNEKCGFINKKGEVVVPIMYDDFAYYRSFTNGMVYPLDQSSWRVGLVNDRGEQVAPCVYNEIGVFSDGYALYRKDQETGFINKQGETIVKRGENFSEGLAAVWEQGKFGFVNPSFKEVIPARYTDAKEFHEGLCPVEKDGKWGVIDTEGKVVIPFEYDEIFNFMNGVAKVKKDGKVGCVNRRGSEIVPCEFRHIGDFENGSAQVCNDNDLWGLLNVKKGLVIPCSYNDINCFYW